MHVRSLRHVDVRLIVAYLSRDGRRSVREVRPWHLDIWSLKRCGFAAAVAHSYIFYI